MVVGFVHEREFSFNDKFKVYKCHLLSMGYYILRSCSKLALVMGSYFLEACHG